MSRLTGLACAAALLAVTGCTMESFNLSTSRDVSRNEQVLGGSPQAVATVAEFALEKMNIKAMRTSKVDSVQLKGSSKNGQPFVLVFERRKSEVGDSTAIRLEWPTKDVDNSFWVDFMSNMEVVKESQRNVAQVGH
jgi:hypothetical protein